MVPMAGITLLQVQVRTLSERGRACAISKRILQAMKNATLRHLAHNIIVVRVTVAVGWLSMVALLSLFALILDGHYF